MGGFVPHHPHNHSRTKNYLSSPHMHPCHRSNQFASRKLPQLFKKPIFWVHNLPLRQYKQGWLTWIWIQNSKWQVPLPFKWSQPFNHKMNKCNTIVHNACIWTIPYVKFNSNAQMIHWFYWQRNKIVLFYCPFLLFFSL